MEALRTGDPAVIGGRYRLLARLGSGGMGVVYLGRSPGGRLVAVKCVREDIAADPEFRQRFAQELEAVRRVGGFHTAQVVDADPDGEQPWLVTAYISGPSLSQAVNSYGPLPEPALRVLGAGLAEALGAIHAAGLVHRDLKPSNVLLAEDGPRVIDFGIARALDGTALTRTDFLIGTPGYMAPEQIEGGTVTPAADVFAFGHVLCHAAGGAPFGTGSPQLLLYRIIHSEPDLTTVPDPLRPIVAACLSRDPADRPTPGQLVERFGPRYDGPAGAWLPDQLRSALTVPLRIPDRAPATPGALPVTLAELTEPLDGQPERARRFPSLGRRLAVLGSALAVMAAAILIPLYVLPGGGEAPFTFGARFLPDCAPTQSGGPSDTPAGPAMRGGSTTSLPTGTPDPPVINTPQDKDAIEVGQPVTLSWTSTGSMSQVFTRLGSGTWTISNWVTTSSCVFTPTAMGLYQWGVVTIDETRGTPSAWSQQRYLFVKAKGSTADNPVADAPDIPGPILPDDQATTPTGQPVELTWTTSGTNSQVNIEGPDGKWTNEPWQPGSSFNFTPPKPGIYVWSVFTSAPGHCPNGTCESGASEERFLVAL
jgi:serine/threonine protein kinase